jgi:endonuclease/exonuclease/phosphatase family metal-dependent hydrolase
MKKVVLLFILLPLFFFTVNCQDRETVRIMSFNIQTFGVSKMAKPEVVALLVDLVSQADIIAVQEVRSLSADPVEQFMALLPDTYRYVIGPRQGRSVSKEQYWVIYDAEKITVMEEDPWPDADEVFERGPYAVYLKTNGTFDFILLNNHIQPRAAEKEIRILPQVVAYYTDLWNDPDVIIAGDLNADGRYFDKALLDSIFPETEYTIIFTDEDTTVAPSHNTYDRIIITSSVLENFTGSFGVMRFDEMYDFRVYRILPRAVSDHYPIWAEFWVGHDVEPVADSVQ